LDRQRLDVAATELSAVPGIASTTAGSSARRFGSEQFAGIETANAALVARANRMLPGAVPRVHRRSTWTPPTWRPTGPARRRRTIDPGQLALAIEGTATHAYAVSFIATNIPTYQHGDGDKKRQSVLDVEAWFRRRTDIEDRLGEAKLGAALRRVPSGHAGVNTVWMWAALLAGNLSVLLQALTGIDEHGRAHAARLRYELLCVPARLIHHGRCLTLRLPPGKHLVPTGLSGIRQLDIAT